MNVFLVFWFSSVVCMLLRGNLYSVFNVFSIVILKDVEEFNLVFCGILFVINKLVLLKFGMVFLSIFIMLWI